MVPHYSRTFIRMYVKKKLFFEYYVRIWDSTLSSKKCDILIYTYVATFMYYDICAYFFTYVHMQYVHMHLLRESQFAERPPYLIEQILNYLCKLKVLRISINFFNMHCTSFQFCTWTSFEKKSVNIYLEANFSKIK